MDLLDYLNPLKHFSQGEYLSFWQYLFKTVLSGFWARLIASVTLLFSFWFGVYRRKLGLALIFFVVTIVVSYFGSLVNAVFWWWR